MDVNNLRTGEKIAGAAGVALLIIMFLGWWGAPDVNVNLGELGGNIKVDTGSATANAWEAASFLDIIWFLTAISGIALAGVALQRTQVNLPVALSAIVAGLGIISVLTIVYRLIDTPYDATRKIGVFLGLIAAAGVAYGGWTAMQEEGTSFQAQADRMQGGGNEPPPPPPPASPPPGPPAA